MRYWAIIFLSLTLGNAVHSPNRTFAQETIDWQKDVDFIKNELPEKHINFFANVEKEKFISACDAASKSIAKNQEYGFAATQLLSLIAMAQDGHTTAACDPTRMQYYPLNFRVLDDGVFVSAISQAHSDLQAAKVVSIGGVKVDEVIQQFKSLFASENGQQLKNIFANKSNAHAFLMFAGAKMEGNTMPFVFLKNGKQVACTLEPITLVEFKRTRMATVTWKTPPLYAQKAKLDYWNDWIADRKTLYFKYNRCRNVAAFKELVDGTDGFIRENEVDKFVVDLRNNGGGNSMVFKPLLNYLKGNEKLNQKGKLFAIIGRQTFSSGMWAALELKEETNAILVGEPTGGKPNHFGEIKITELPSSKIKVQYSTRYWHMMKDSDPQSITPDIPVKFSSEEFFTGKDPYLDAALNFEVNEN